MRTVATIRNPYCGFGVTAPQLRACPYLNGTGDKTCQTGCYDEPVCMTSYPGPRPTHSIVSRRHGGAS